MRISTSAVLALTGLASLAAATPIRIVRIDAFAPMEPESLDVGDITFSVKGVDGKRVIDGPSGNWWKEFMNKHLISSNAIENMHAPPHHHHHPHGGPHDHSLPATDASLIPSWMYDTPLSSSRYVPVVARPPFAASGWAPEGSSRGIKLVTRPDGLVVYESVSAQNHAGIGCVFRSFTKMVQSLTAHELFIFVTITTLMLLVILRLAFLIILLLHRAHAYANECPGEAAARRRRHLAREAEVTRDQAAKVEEDIDPVPAYTVDAEEVDEKDSLLPAYAERA